MDSQPEFFEELPLSANPRQEFAEFRAGKKIIRVPCSFWKDGRIRADLTKFGGGEVVSRNGINLQERVIRALRESFGTIVEAVYREFARSKPRDSTRSRISNKRAITSEANAPVRYINPFLEKKWRFGKCPDWLLTRREPTAIEKHVYGKLLYPQPPICQRWDQNEGVIFGLNQRELANALGIPRQSANQALVSLRRRGLIECIGAPGGKQVIRFLLHKWIDETCQVSGQVYGLVPAITSDSSCRNGGQVLAAKTDKTCPERGQLPEGIEKKESRRKERRESHSRRQYGAADF
jgi:Crp-like helix-turn-helix domain